MDIDIPRGNVPRDISSARAVTPATSIYPRLLRLAVPISPDFFQVTATNALNAVTPLDTTLITNFAAKFAVLFREYVILGFNLQLRLIQQSATAAGYGGIIRVYLDESSNSSPTATSSEQSAGLNIANDGVESPNRYNIKWKNRNLIDLAWGSTATNVTPVWIKLYSDSPIFGLPTSTTFQIAMTGTVLFAFRGFV